MNGKEKLLSLSSKERTPAFWILISVMAGIILLGSGFLVGGCFERITHTSNSLVGEVDTKPRSGIIVSNVEDEVCLVLFNEDNKADDTISCAEKEQILNLGHQLYGQDNIKALVGEFYQVEWLEIRGVIRGLIFVSLNTSE